MVDKWNIVYNLTVGRHFTNIWKLQYTDLVAVTLNGCPKWYVLDLHTFPSRDYSFVQIFVVQLKPSEIISVLLVITIFFSILHSDNTVLKNNFIWNKCSVMKCPKWMWIIHPGPLEFGFLERIFCQRFRKSCLVTEITWALTQARNWKTRSLWAALWKLPRWGVPPSNNLRRESRDEAARDISVRLKSRRWRMLAGVTTCQQKKHSSTGKLWEGCLSEWTDSTYIPPCLCSRSVTEDLCLLFEETEAAIVVVLREPDGTVS